MFAVSMLSRKSCTSATDTENILQLSVGHGMLTNATNAMTSPR